MILDTFRQIAADFPHRSWWLALLSGIPAGVLGGWLTHRWKLTRFQGCSMSVLISLLWSVYWSAWRWL